MDQDIIIVSGLPRSGTSLMMQLLAAGGVPVVTDDIRAADADNPRGYWEFETAKKIKQDAAWLPGTRGMAFKAVSLLLYDLPATERYRIIFMERNLDEVLISQEKMLERLQKKAAPREQMKRSYQIHLNKLWSWLRQQPHMKIRPVNYNDLVAQPQALASEVNEFLGGQLNLAKMAGAVDASLYRNKA